MIALLCFVLTVLVSPFKAKSRLEAENAALIYLAPFGVTADTQLAFGTY